jgi:transposase-like protein
VLAEVITVERRRRWKGADKARIVAEAFDPETRAQKERGRRIVIGNQGGRARDLLRREHDRSHGGCGLAQPAHRRICGC